MNTPITPNTQPPTAPTNLTATASGNTITLNWTASTDDVSVTGYFVERQDPGSTSFVQIGTTTTATTYNDTGLAANSTYSYRVRTTDGAGNLSPYSNVASATTPATIPGRVATYAFNEGTGTTVTDASGNGHTGTLVNATWTTAGKYGNALSFNGTNARVDINDAASLHLTTAMTLEAWVNPSAVSSAWRDLVYKGNDNYYLMAATDYSSLPGGGIIAAGTYAETFGTTILATNTWTHLATTYDGATLQLYGNGVQVSSVAKTGTILTSINPLQLGGDSIYGQYFQGVIDEVRVYNVALTAAQIQADMNTPITPDTQPPTAPTNLMATASGNTITLNWTASTDDVSVTGYFVERQDPGSTSFVQIGATTTATTYNDTGLAANSTYSYRVRTTDGAGNLSPYSNVASATTPATIPGLVAAYSFDAGTGSTVADTSGNGNTGTIVNATWTTAGKYGNALSFNGTNARVDINDAASVHLATAVAVEAWVNPSAVSSAWRDLVYKGNDNYYLMATTDHSSLPGGGIIAAGTYAETFGTTILATNTWTHLATTYDGATLQLYVNGVQVSSVAKTGTILTSINPLQLGGDSIYGQYFQGVIDEVRVYNVALTAAQVQADMNTPITPNTQPPTAPTNLTATASGNTITLNWTASSGDVSVTGYFVERQDPGSTSFVQIGTTTTATTYNDSGLAANSTYSYRVRATNGAGNLSPYSNLASATTSATIPGLVAAYSFDAGTGSTMTDTSGNGNT